MINIKSKWEFVLHELSNETLPTTSRDGIISILKCHIHFLSHAVLLSGAIATDFCCTFFLLDFSLITFEAYTYLFSVSITPQVIKRECAQQIVAVSSCFASILQPHFIFFQAVTLPRRLLQALINPHGFESTEPLHLAGGCTKESAALFKSSVNHPSPLLISRSNNC